MYVKPIVFGGLDGVLTCFAIVMVLLAAGSTAKLFCVGFSSLLADAVSMGVGEFLSSKAEVDYAKVERERESWELHNYPEGEVKEMKEIYVEKGMSEEDAQTMFSIMAKPQYHDLFVDFMMREELGLDQPSDDDTKEAYKAGVVMFFDFCVFGSSPALVRSHSHDVSVCAQPQSARNHRCCHHPRHPLCPRLVQSSLVETQLGHMTSKRPYWAERARSSLGLLPSSRATLCKRDLLIKIVVEPFGMQSNGFKTENVFLNIIKNNNIYK